VTNPVEVDTTTERPASRSTRRALLGLGVVGAALAASRSVGAAATAEADAVATFVIGLELAARDLYRAAPDDFIADGLASVLASNHAAYADRISGITGLPSSGADAALFDSLEAAFSSGDTAAALELENSLVATHGELLGLTDNSTVLSAITSIISAESRIAAVIAAESGSDIDAILVNSAAPLAPEA
jgi:hypothetical protein